MNNFDALQERFAEFENMLKEKGLISHKFVYSILGFLSDVVTNIFYVPSIEGNVELDSNYILCEEIHV